MSLPLVRSALRIVVLTALTGLGAGLGALLVAALLRLVQHSVYGYASGTFLDGVREAPPGLRVAALAVAGLVGGFGWWALRRWARPAVRVEEALDGAGMPSGTTVATAALQITVVALGASIGREVAPRMLGALVADKLSVHVSPRTRRILVACGAGAGLGAVYNVPLGGALFSLEVLLGEFGPSAVLVATSTSVIATLVARPVVPNTFLYLTRSMHQTPSLVVYAALVGPILGFVGWVFLRLNAAERPRPEGWRVLIVMPLVFTAVGTVAIAFPALLGNGRALGQVAFGLLAPAGVLALLALLKLLVTTATIASGAEGGSLTPSVAIGAAAGAAGAVAWSLVQPDLSISAGAVVGAAAVLAVTLNAPLTAGVLVLEFTGSSAQMILPVLITVAGAALTRRLVEDLEFTRRHGSVDGPH